ncbi:MAG: HAD family hydrolase [Rhodospirillales bacterium]
MSKAIRAVTFDLWDTLIRDDSDEPRRRAKGLRTKADERRQLVWEALDRRRPIAFDDVRLAYDVAEAAFNTLWKEHSITWTIAERLEVIFGGLGRTLPGDDDERLIEALGRMEVDIPPDPVAGAREALEALSGRYKLGVVSDTILTPGARLRDLLEAHGLKRYFAGFAFSDEVGHSKPDPAMFRSAAGQLGVEVTEMVHVGDRDHNDVRGPQALGMKAVLFTAVRDADRNGTSADAVCDSHANLPGAIDALAG